METFAAVPQWLKDARELARPDICGILVGNKLDLAENRQVEMGEGAKYAQENGLNFLETSALTGENVHEVFQILSKTILSKIEGGKIVF
jgi:GTPase SAR1 and related small G proteins